MSVQPLAIHQPTFSGGEVSPSLYGRVDLARYQTSLRTCRNAFIKPEGGVCKRAGTRFVAETKDPNAVVRLIEFQFSTDQNYILEFGNQYMRVIRVDTGQVLDNPQSIVSITQASPCVVEVTGHGYSNGDQIVLDSIVGMTELNLRAFIVQNVTTDTFSLQDIAGNAIDSTGFTAYTSGGNASIIYEIATPYLEAELFDIRLVQSGDIVYLAHPNHAPRELARVTDTNWTLNAIDFVPDIDTPATPSGSYETDAGSSISLGSDRRTEEYLATAFNAETGDESLASASTTVTRNDPFEAGARIRITVARNASLGTVTDYNIYKRISGIFGYIGTVSDPGPTVTLGTTPNVFFDDINTVPDSTDTPPEFNNPFANNNHPGTVTFYQDRLSFAGSDSDPQTVWLSQTGNYDNHFVSNPPVPDDAIEFTVNGREINRIQHMVELRDDLLLMTNGSIRSASGQGERVPITPASIFVRPQTYHGIDRIEPLVIDDSAVYIENRDNAVRDLFYSFGDNGYIGTDLSITSRHLFDGFTLKDWAYARAPDSLVWASRSDGKLLGMTYLREQQISAWHQHDTDGTFESVASAGNDSENLVYYTVARTINGQTRRYIEVMESRFFTDQLDAFFVDSGLKYDGSPETTFGGLWHLEGKDVAIYADGNVLPRQTVTNGSVTIANAASKVTIGLPFTAEMETLELNIQSDRGPLLKLKRKLGRIFLQVNKTRGLKLADTNGELEELKERSTEAYGDPIALTTGLIEFVPATDWQRSGRVRIVSEDPLPFEVLSIMPEMNAAA